MRTYSREDFSRAKAEWQDYGSEWETTRRLAVDRGMLFPPSGTRHDDRDAENPSQRAIVYRAMVDNPTELRRIIARSHSWSQVVDGIIGLETRLRLDLDDSERDIDADRKERPSPRHALMSLADILRRIGDSL